MSPRDDRKPFRCFNGAFLRGAALVALAIAVLAFVGHRFASMLLGCAALMVMTLAGARVQKTTGANAAAAAWIYGGGTLLMAWLTARTTAYPRWAWFAAGGVLVVTLVIAAARLPAPAQVKAWTSTAWMLPWLFLVTANSPAPATGPCSPHRAWSGPLLVGTSAAFSLILLGVWLM